MKKYFSLFLCCFLILTSCITTFATTTGDNNVANDEKKVVYLTFDDGPGGKNTTKILDKLKEYDVKATFFVVGELAKDQPDIIKRMHDEGHTIGIHTYTHNRNKIYRSEDIFLEENLLCQKTIEEITGEKPTALRFPFGCNNGIYKLTENMVASLHSNGMKIYDWNVDTTDGMNPGLAPYKIAENGKSTKANAVVLMHCGFVNKNSGDAVESIIKYYKENGYEFKAIDDSTPEIYKLRKR